ncbi:GDSL-type esterase/lipase family protein [Pleomorphomonas sp. JP5]|uniref:GDSL-type esterase/lipase family protein n=1 Tax=Pleomorphomonas sp. JP5 TaxID=2942998 RepID=UPI0020441966|nr:GDSL-type esterase/lipase family protein [Pleomorphomonas sp. JP5]MCM5558355.1 GDSL-type esterase/lipase family protein [Pleomorphomonas sp. JP5]
MQNPGRSATRWWVGLSAILCLLALAEARAGEPTCDPLAIDLTVTPQRTLIYPSLKETLKVEAARPEWADIVLIGDSLFAGWRSDLPAAFPSSSIYDFAVGGDRAPNVLWRLESTDLSSLRPLAAALLIGTNDLAAGTPACAVATGIETIVERLQVIWPKTPVFVLTIPPRGADFHALDDRRLEVNRAIATLADRLPNVHAVAIDDDAFTCGQYDKSRQANAAAQRLSCGNYADDNLHFSTAGYVVLGNTLRAAAKAALGKDVFH